ncbi:MAG: hypothetical protein JWO07_438 [Candidatus Saccharibacteria bacterium]|nr:hypothetical protein [Candidatus Saccharibacteria bacterium]
MVKKTNKTTKKVAAKKVLRAHYGEYSPLNHDVMLSMLIVSLFVNLFVLTGWIALQVTTAFNSEVASFLFHGAN